MQPATCNKPKSVLNSSTFKNGSGRIRYLGIILPCTKGQSIKKSCLRCQRIQLAPRYNEYSIRQAKEIELPVVVDVIMEAHKKKYEDHKIFDKLLGAYGQCLREKKQAQLEHRQFRQWKEINKMKVKLAQIRGQPVDWSGTYETPQERRQVMLWMQKRKFVVLVAVRLRDPHERRNMINNYIEQQQQSLSTQRIHQSRSPQNGSGNNNEIRQQGETTQQQQQKIKVNILENQSDLQIAQNQKQQPYAMSIGGTQFSYSNISSVQLSQSREISSQDVPCLDNVSSVQTQSVSQIQQIGDSKQRNTESQQSSSDYSDEQCQSQSQDQIYFDEQYLDEYWNYEIVGSATISLSRVEASLPPPFPSNKEFRMYITNVSVKDGWRRLGVATELMKYAETVGFRWGEGSCWLHVDDDNPGARMLYDKLGYKVVAADPWWKLTNRRTLMMKPLNKNNTLNAPPSTSLIQGVEGYRDEKGVFVWSAKIQTESKYAERQDS